MFKLGFREKDSYFEAIRSEIYRTLDLSLPFY